MQNISIILPAYNEENNIRQSIEDSIHYLENQKSFERYEIIAVNDGSIDQTANILNNLTKKFNFLKIVTHNKNKGYGGALLSGINEARYPWLLLMDADGQFQLNSIDELIVHMDEFKIITGYRLKRMDSAHRIVLGKTYTYLACIIFSLEIRDINCGFKLIKKDALDFNSLNSHAGAFYTDFFIKAKNEGHKIKEVPVKHYQRTEGRSTGANLNVIVTAITDIVRLKNEKKISSR